MLSKESLEELRARLIEQATPEQRKIFEAMSDEDMQSYVDDFNKMLRDVVNGSGPTTMSKLVEGK